MSSATPLIRILIAALTPFLLHPAAGAAAPASGDTLFILDASGSMWGQIKGEAKIGIARRVMKGLVGGLPDSASVALIAYGHRSKGDCNDIETVIAPGPLDRARTIETVEGLNPKGKTPITRSVNEAFRLVKERGRAGTIILVSDGVESCGGDPCQTVRDARAAGIDFVMHVVGFDVQKENVAQLECAAQAGGGYYFPADSAEALSAALEKAVVPVPDGRLSIKTLSNDKLEDTGVRVFDAATGKEVAFNRTYSSAETNPRVFPLEDGRYNVQVKAIRLKGDIQQELRDIEIKGALVEKVVDFTPGVLKVKVTRNGKLSDATVAVLRAGTREQVTGGRSYESASSNPVSFNIMPGRYDIEVGSVKIKGAEKQRIEGIEIHGNDSVKREINFDSGTLRIGVTHQGQPVDAVVKLRDLQSGKQVAGGRTYTDPGSNPKAMEVPPGSYRVEVNALKVEGKPEKIIEVTVTAGEVTEQVVDF